MADTQEEDFGPAFQPIPDEKEDFGPAFQPIEDEAPAGFQAMPEASEVGPVPQTKKAIPEGVWGRMFTEGVPSEDGTEMVYEPNEMLRTMTNFGFQLGGAIGGAKMGAKRGAVGAMVGFVGGTGVGIAAGVMAPDAAMGVYRLMGGSDDDPSLTFEQAAYLYEKEVAVNAAFGGAIGLFKGGQRIAGRLLMGNITKKSWSKFENAREAFIHLAPFHIASETGGFGQRLITGYTAAVSGMPFIGSAIRLKQARVVQEVDEALTRLPGLYSGISYSFPDIGKAIHKDAAYLMAKQEDHWRSILNPIEDSLTALGAKVAPKNAFAAGEAIAQRFKERALVPLADNKAAELAAKEATELAKAAEIPEVALVIKRLGMLGGREATVVAQTLETGSVARFQHQPFLGMKDFAREIQAAMWKLDKGTPRKLFADLLTAVNKDLAENVRGSPEVLSKAAEYQAQLREFSLESSQLFSHQTAKALGLASREMPDIMDISFKRWGKFAAKADPQAIAELGRMMSPETMGAVARSYLEHAAERSIIEEPGKGRVFDASRWGKILGIGSIKGPEQLTRLQATQKVLELGGGHVPVSHLEAIYEASQMLAGAPVRDLSSYLARRTGISGVQGIVGAALPGVTASKGNPIAALLHFGMLMGPSMFLNGIVTNHALLRPVLENIPEKATAVVKAAAWAQAARMIYNEANAAARKQIRNGLRPDERLGVPDLKDWSDRQKFESLLGVMTDMWETSLKSLEGEEK